MTLEAGLLQALAARANLAPSVHNTQPARWRQEDDGSLLLLADLSRQLPAGDPHGRDMGLSCGAALEGMVMAMSEHGLGVRVEDAWQDEIIWRPGFRLAARVVIEGEAKASPDAAWVERRFTWRDVFEPVSAEVVSQVSAWAERSEDVTLVQGDAGLDAIADFNDRASLAVMRSRAFRQELVDWMRLSPSHPSYRLDGLNLEALRMSRGEGRAAAILLPSRLFDLLDRLGLARSILAEKQKTRSAVACALFHRPVGESVIQSGRAFYRFWLAFTRFGLAAWPMAALADVDWAAAALASRYDLPPGRRLINVLRIGKAAQPIDRFRLAASDLVLDARPD